MRKRFLLTLALIGAVFGAISPALPALASSAPTRIVEAARVLKEMSQQKDGEALAQLLHRARGLAIFPEVLKAGILVGGRYGEGLVLKRTEKGAWQGPNFVKIKGLSYGPQIGVQKTALVLVIMNDRGLDGFRGDKVTLGGDLSVAAGPVGRHVEAATDTDLKASIYSYSMSKGVFAGLSLEGAVLTPDDEANAVYWKSPLRPDEALGRSASDGRLQPLMAELAELERRQGSGGTKGK